MGKFFTPADVATLRHAGKVLAAIGALAVFYAALIDIALLAQIQRGGRNPCESETSHRPT